MAIEFNDNIHVKINRPTDFRFGPFSDINQANSYIPISQRYHGLLFGIYSNPLDILNSDVEYWYYVDELGDNDVKLLSYDHPIYNSYDITLNTDLVLSKIKTDSIGSVVELSVRQLTPSDISAVPISRTLTFVTNNGLIGGAGPNDLSSDRSWTFGLTGQALALHQLNTTGYIVRTGTDTVSSRTITEGVGISITNGDGVAGNTVISSTITQYTDQLARNAISLTTVGNSGASTYSSSTGTFNIPNYTLAGLGGQPLSVNLTSLSGLSYVSPSLVKMTAAGTFTLDTNEYYLASNPNGYTSNVGTVTSITTSNGIGGGPITVTGNLSLVGQALSFHNLNTNGIVVRTDVDSILTRTIEEGAGISITNGDGVSGNPIISANGVLSVDSNCGESPITNNTDIWAIIDVTSGPYTFTFGPQNITTLCNALGDWYSDYQLSNPEFTGNLYIGTTSRENYLSYMPRIKGDVSQFSFINNWYDTTGNVTSAPANWNTSNWVSPTDILLLAFVNEADFQYHSNPTVPTLNAQPTATYNTDFTTFVDSLSTLNNFSGIIYPALDTSSSDDRNFLIHAFAVLNNLETITSNDLVIPFGDNYTSNFDGFNETNPYKTNSVGLWDYNWFGVLDKGLDNGLLNFTAQDFANDLNSILSGNITQSVSLIHSYENQNLILRGLRSSDITFEVGANGCIDLSIPLIGNSVPLTRTITINGITQDLSQDRTWDLNLDAFSNGNSGTGTVNFNWNNGYIQTVTLTGNCTFAFSNPRSGSSYQIIITQDAVGSRIITWPVGIKWKGGVVPTLTGFPNSVDIVTISYDGTSYFAVFSGDFKTA